MFASNEETAEVGLATESSASNFFHGGHWGQCFELVSHLCQYGDSILLVSGPEGIGKTALKQALIQTCTDRFSFCNIIADEDTTADEIKSQIMDEPHMADRTLVALIDNAEKLDLNVISAILQLKNTNIIPGRLQLVLFALPQLEAKIQRSPLKDKFNEVVHTIELETLTLNEVEAFLNYLWQMQDNTTDLPLDKATIKKIYTNSGGVPGKVQQLSEAILNGTEVKKANLGNKRLSPFSVGLTVSFGLLFCLLAFLWPGSNEENKSVEMQASLPDISAELQQDQLSNNTIVAQEAGIETIGGAPNSLHNSNDTNVLSDAADLVQVSDTQQASQVHQSQQLVTADNVNAAPEELLQDNYSDKLARLESKLLALQQQVEQEQDARLQAERKVQELLQREFQPKKTEVKQKSATKQLTVKPSAKRGDNSENLLLALPAKNYTLQLIASSQESKVKDFIKQNHLEAKARYFSSTYRGKPWYIVVYGNYSSKEAAVQALKSLPQQVKLAQPWPREMSSVQRTINKKK
jgi:septal ring-binding cell division protein DamX/type II secretory pathway predicted ATPase ExeA